MPTADRTTILATLDELLSKLRANLIADPPTAAKPFRSVSASREQAEGVARPYLSVALTRMSPIATVEGDKLFRVEMSLRVVVDAAPGDPHTAVLDAMGAVDDCLDNLLATGVLEGAEGFDDREWAFQQSRATSGTPMASASAAQSFVVKVERGHNRVPAA